MCAVSAHAGHTQNIWRCPLSVDSLACFRHEPPHRRNYKGVYEDVFRRAREDSAAARARVSDRAPRSIAADPSARD